MSNGSPRHYDAAQTLIDTEEGHLMIENFVNIFFVTSLSVSLHNRLDFSLSLSIYIYIYQCSVSMVWVQIPLREEQKFDSSKI